MIDVLVREGLREETREGHVKTEGGIAVMPPQAKECQAPPGAGGGEEGFSPRAFGGSVALLTPSFCTSGLQKCETINFF